MKLIQTAPMSKKWMVATCLLALVAAGCDSRSSTSETRDHSSADSDERAVKFILSSDGSVPAVELTYKISPIEHDSELEWVRKPVGNVVYLAVRDCSSAYPPDHSDIVSVAAFDFAVANGRVTDVSKAEPKLRDEKDETIDAAGFECLRRELEESTVDFPEAHTSQLTSKTFQVTTQVEMSRSTH